MFNHKLTLKIRYKTINDTPVMYKNRYRKVKTKPWHVFPVSRQILYTPVKCRVRIKDMDGK